MAEHKTEGRYKAEVIADSSGQWCGNALRFDTPEAGKEYAQDLSWRWTAVREWRVVDTLTEATVASSQASV